MPKLKRDGEERATDFVESLDRGLRLLQSFGDATGPMTLSDVARAADLPRATARRILFTLAHGGFVSTDGKLFSLTPHVLTLAGSYLRSNQVVAVLQPVLDRIATSAQEISSLAVLDADEVVFIARGSPARVFSAGLDIGYRLPAFCTSVGRAMLGQFDNVELASKLAAMRREPMTPHTVTDPKLLLAAHRRRSRAGLFAGRSRGRAGLPIDFRADPPLRRRHCRGDQHGRACRSRLDRRDDRPLPAAASRGRGLASNPCCCNLPARKMPPIPCRALVAPQGTIIRSRDRPAQPRPAGRRSRASWQFSN